MLNTAATLKAFYSSFDLPAYTLSSIPDEVTLPYITFPLEEPDWNRQKETYCQVWYPKNRLSDLLTKADQIAAAIGDLKRFEQTGGYVVLYPSTPLIQIMSDDGSQSAYIKLIMNAYHLPGA